MPAAGHFVEFYELDEILVEHIAEFIGRGLATGEPVLVVAGALHLEQLAARGGEVAAALRSGRIHVLDARATLAKLVVQASISAEVFEREIAARVHALGSGDRRVWAYGEMVDLLWRDGDARGALELEALWNGLGNQTGLALMCAYNKANFIRESAHGEGIADVCRVHDHVVPAQRVTPVPLRAKP